MRKIGLAMVCAAALAACGQQQAGEAPTAQSGAPAGFPDLTQASYRAEAIMLGPDGATTPVVMIRDGARMRMEFGQQIIISNPQAGETIMIYGEGGQRMAMRVNDDNTPDMNEVWGQEAANVTRTGTCSVAGESGVEWSHTPEGDTTADTACVTSDGIILRGTDDGRVTWETTSLSRGPQDPALFTIPAGVQVMDMGAIQSQAEQAMEQMKGKMGQ